MVGGVNWEVGVARQMWACHGHGGGVNGESVGGGGLKSCGRGLSVVGVAESLGAGLLEWKCRHWSLLGGGVAKRVVKVWGRG